MRILLSLVLQQHIKSLSGDSMLGVVLINLHCILYEIDLPIQNTFNTF